MPTDRPSAPRRLLSHSDRLFNGALWMIAMRWGVQLLGLVSIVVLARLLDKEDFGLVAMAAAAIALPEALTQVDVERAVIREKAPDKGIYNTAWTIRAGQRAIVALLLLLSAPWVAGFYEDPRLVNILYVLSVVVFLQGLENIWVVSFVKDYRFHHDFLYNVACKVMGVAVTITLAVWLQSYWALVYGQATTAVLRVALSYMVVPAIARPDLSRWREIWSFSQWSLVKGLAMYSVNQADRLILGRLLGAEMVGAYAVAKQIAQIPANEISMPVNRALLPGLASIQDSPDRLAAALSKSTGAVAATVFPACVGLAVTAPLAVPLALGPGWESTVPILQLLALTGPLAALRGVLTNALTVIGRYRADALLMWARALLFLGPVVPATMWYGAEGAAATFLVSGIVFFGILLVVFRRLMPEFTISQLLQALLRPTLAVAAMTVCVAATRSANLDVLALQLLAEVTVGVVSYGVVLFLGWLAMGRPDGLEQLLINRLPWLRGRASQAGKDLNQEST